MHFTPGNLTQYRAEPSTRERSLPQYAQISAEFPSLHSPAKRAGEIRAAGRGRRLLCPQAGLTLGDNSDQVSHNIAVINQLESDRLKKFHQDNPDMFLPPDIDVSGEEFNSNNVFNDSNSHLSPVTHTSVDMDPGPSWIEVSRKKDSRCKKKSFY